MWTILQSDETSARVGKATWWTWVFHNGDSACFRIRPSRGKVVVEEFLGEVRPAFWVSDRFGAQMGWASTGHQACLAHLLRDVQFAIDAGDAAFAPAIKGLLKRAVAIGRRLTGSKTPHSPPMRQSWKRRSTDCSGSSPSAGRG